MADQIQVHPISQTSILYIYSMKDEIDMEPAYQRMGDIWPLSKRRLLIDSILNGYDIPKIYVHQFLKPNVTKGKITRWAMVDGKQRLNAIIEFIENRFALDDDFIYMTDPSVAIGGLTYSELAKAYPKIKMRFDGFSLPIMGIQTDDIDLIEDMFSRLNEAAPLNAAEKRNAFGGPLPLLIQELAKHDFFTSRVQFSNSRYRHYDVIAKLLLLELTNGITDTKKLHLDKFVKSFKEGNKDNEAAELRDSVRSTLDRISERFVQEDYLLRTVGIIPVYYWLTNLLMRIDEFDALERSELLRFETKREENRKLAQENEDSEKVSFDLLEFDRLSQSPNDAHAIRFRLLTIARFLLSDDKYERLIREIERDELDESQ